MLLLRCILHCKQIWCCLRPACLMAERLVCDLQNGFDTQVHQQTDANNDSAQQKPRHRPSSLSNGSHLPHAIAGTDSTSPNGKRCMRRRWDGSRLYCFDEAPPVLQFNRFVRSGYRAGLTPCGCLRSVLQYHNETGNILSHLGPMVILLVGIATGMLPAWSAHPVAFYGNVVPIVVCLWGSVMYHTFMANHPKYRTWITLDVCGIFALFLCGVHVVLWWGLRCFPLTRAVYTIAYYVVAGVAVFASTHANNVLWRAIPMLFLCLLRLGITVVRWILTAGSPSATRYFALMEVFSFAGGVVNVCRIPERWVQPSTSRAPAMFDVWFNSHMIMHVLVVVAMALLHRGCAEEYHHYVKFPGCPS